MQATLRPPSLAALHEPVKVPTLALVPEVHPRAAERRLVDELELGAIGPGGGTPGVLPGALGPDADGEPTDLGQGVQEAPGRLAADAPDERHPEGGVAADPRHVDLEVLPAEPPEPALGADVRVDRLRQGFVRVLALHDPLHQAQLHGLRRRVGHLALQRQEQAPDRLERVAACALDRYRGRVRAAAAAPVAALKELAGVATLGVHLLLRRVVLAECLPQAAAVPYRLGEGFPGARLQGREKVPRHELQHIRVLTVPHKREGRVLAADAQA
eukprot:CAMPEP_0179316842 /NCGR_PEP_ID=MMETSP0797-20121207/55918_1 /TAXON_ID=47934 /ORGANISM="Dinophysis acuminata, Strain DAEP01" /LENGTH=270 /DNA_ID=CAMNT_0021027675 /DNA_START=15 /DNA_END=824 /DNA_ORIENTATION=+